jgi:hypothetical protein
VRSPDKFGIEYGGSLPNAIVRNENKSKNPEGIQCELKKAMFLPCGFRGMVYVKNPNHV